MLLQAFLLDKGIHGTLHELKTRPEWLTIPVRGLQSILTETGSSG